MTVVSYVHGYGMGATVVGHLLGDHGKTLCGKTPTIGKGWTTKYSSFDPRYDCKRCAAKREKWARSKP